MPSSGPSHARTFVKFVVFGVAVAVGIMWFASARSRKLRSGVEAYVERSRSAPQGPTTLLEPDEESLALEQVVARSEGTISYVRTGARTSTECLAVTLKAEGGSPTVVTFLLRDPSGATDVGGEFRVAKLTRTRTCRCPGKDFCRLE